jgi:hypothetical protein
LAQRIRVIPRRLVGRLLEAGDGRGGEGLGLQRRHRGVQPAEHLGRAGVAVGRDAPQQPRRLAHRGGRLGVVPDDVADHQHRGAAGCRNASYQSPPTRAASAAGR